jgi:pyruvate kinase
VLALEAAKVGDNVVIIAGIPFGQSGTTNNLRVIKL